MCVFGVALSAGFLSLLIGFGRHAVFVSKDLDKRRQQFSPDFEAHQLPREFGGDLDFTFDMGTWTEWYLALEHEAFDAMSRAGVDVTHVYPAEEAATRAAKYATAPVPLIPGPLTPMRPDDAELAGCKHAAAAPSS